MPDRIGRGYPAPMQPCVVCDRKLEDNESEPRFSYVYCLKHADVPPAYLDDARAEYLLTGKTHWDRSGSGNGALS